MRADRLQVRAPEGVAIRIRPRIAEAEETASLLAVGRCPFGDRGGRGIVERPEHCRHIAQWRRELATLRGRPIGLAFEIEHDPAGIDAQQLPEVQVAVDAREQPTRRQRTDLVEARDHRRADLAERVE